MGSVTALPRSRPLTRADLDAMPDDGHRYELIDGALIVTPAPGERHQTAVGELHLLLRRGCPDDLKVLLAPFDVTLADDTVVQPDLLVCRRRDLTRRDLPTAPVLAVEVVSPSTRRIDLTLKVAARSGRMRVVLGGRPAGAVTDGVGPRGRRVRRAGRGQRRRGVRRERALRRDRRAERPARLLTSPCSGPGSATPPPGSTGRGRRDCRTTVGCLLGRHRSTQGAGLRLWPTRGHRWRQIARVPTCEVPVGRADAGMGQREEVGTARPVAEVWGDNCGEAGGDSGEVCG